MIQTGLLVMLVRQYGLKCVFDDGQLLYILFGMQLDQFGHDHEYFIYFAN